MFYKNKGEEMKKIIIVFMILASFSITSLKVGASTEAYERGPIGRSLNLVTGGPSSVNYEHQVLKDEYIDSVSLYKYDVDSSTNNTFISSSFSGISQSISSTFGLNTEIDGVYKGIRGEISFGYDQAGIESASEYYTQYYYYNYKKLLLYSLHMQNLGYENQTLKNNLSADFLDYLSSLQNGASNFDDFFDRFGTHLIISGEFGGKLEHKYSMFSNEVVMGNALMTTLKSSIVASVPLTGSLNLDASSSISTISELVNKSYYESDIINQYGGSIYDGNYVNWRGSLTESNSGLIGFNSNSLVPLWDIVPTQFTGLANKMEQAFNNYYQVRINNIQGYYEPTKYIQNSETVTYQRNFEYKITDSGRENQSYDIIFKDISIDVLEELGYTKFTLSISGKYWEDRDGYQYLFVYSTTTVGAMNFSNETMLVEKKYEHSSGKQSPTIKDFSYSIGLTDLSVFPENTNGIILRYGASGFQEDDWKNTNVSATITFYK